jgi:hypothetical protein
LYALITIGDSQLHVRLSSRVEGSKLSVLEFCSRYVS